MDKTELYSIKTRFSNVLNKFDKLKVKLISNGTEFDNLNLQINDLKLKIAALTMQSTIDEFFTVKELLNNIEIYIFDLDEIININPDVNPVIPTVIAIVLSVDTSKLATISPQNANDPQNRISSVKYSLKSGNTILQELTTNNPKASVTFTTSLTAGTFFADALYTYTLSSGNSQFILVSNTVVVEGIIPPIIIPTVASIILSLDNNKMATVSSQNINDTQNRISSVKYSLKSNNITIQELTSNNSKVNVTFANSLTTGTYVAEALYTYTISSRNSQFILISNTIVIEDSSSIEVATVYVTNRASWSSGFNCSIEIVSSTDKDYAGNWELTFDTSINYLAQWQIITTKIGNKMSLVSGKDWAGKSHFSLIPKGTVSISDINSSGATFDDNIMKNTLLNGQPTKVIFR